ncbi:MULTISPECIES: MFS transporter [unclassified Leptolyngbya]|uniref:MFS transporter n=1 Tax=unclassified Leptolyngbya TaxID=2650499 RepID=UPI001686A2C9|nr:MULTISPECIES: MFS transporter [unclassified Leptolyngbya]MBD1911795.1 MFS transporter [Leptolyngbya sp. FACHB-8]MBD2153315.1 MFS transporter [Leptolyngbya sp. FACHB-16]
MKFSVCSSARVTEGVLERDRLPLFCICAGMLVFFTQVTVLFPVLPLYLSQRWANAPVGLVVGAMAAGLLFFRPGIGWLLDHWGRKAVLWVGLGIMLGILPLYLWSSDPTWLMGVRVAHGISQAAFATASQTMLVDLVGRDRRTAMLGYLAMSNTIGFSLGPLLGSWAFAQMGFVGVVGFMGGLTLLGFFLTLPLPWLWAVRSAQSAEPPHPFPWDVVLRFPVRDATLVFFITSFLHGGVVTFLPLFVPNSALFYSLNALVAVGVRFALGRWGDRISQRWITTLAILSSSTALVGLAIAPQFLASWSILYGLGFGAMFPVLSAMVSLSAPGAARGRVYSVFLAGFDGGMTLGGAGVEPLVQVIPLSRLFLLLGCTGCLVSGYAFRQFAKPT